MAQREPAISEEWHRPEMPKRHRPAGLLLGAFLMVAGIGMGIGAAFSLTEGLGRIGDRAVLYLAAPVTLLGIWTFSFATIVSEIRQSAFEAARRAGETGPATRE